MKILSLSLLLCAAAASAQTIDDSDLSRPLPYSAQNRLHSEGSLRSGAWVFPARAPQPRISSGLKAVSGTFLLADRRGVSFPARLTRARLVGSDASSSWTAVDAAGQFSFPLPGKPGTFRVRFSLDNLYWSFQDPKNDASYEWESPSFSLGNDEGADLGNLSPAPSSENGNLAVLHLTYLAAVDFLQAQGDVNWWKKTLTVNWPGQGDFFEPWSWSLTLTNALAWDVVLHELGHAVMHGAMKAAPAGGQHKIDECYTPALAWSEGWATFFAGAVSLPADDADARFEFLVPRRAPIRVENVPEDVCRGQASEWRVAAGLWDLHDTHPDGGDQYTLGFSRLWRALTGGQATNSLASAWNLISKTLNAGERRAAEDSLIQNTLLKSRPPLVITLSSPNWENQ